MTGREIRLGPDILNSDDAAMRRDWLVTNGLGGYASASVAGANTRRYHGLLVAALCPPVGRAVLLSKVEETLDFVGPNGATTPTFALSCNLYPDVIYPQGHRLLVSWAAFPAPTWTWIPAPGIKIEKRIWMEQDNDTTCVAYRLVEAPADAVARLHLVPLVAWKNFHTEMRAADTAPETFWFSPAPLDSDDATPRSSLRVDLPPIPGVRSEHTTLHLDLTDRAGRPHPQAAFTDQPYWYYRFQHPRERERGLDAEEDLYALGMFSVVLKVGEPVALVASLEEPRAPLAVDFGAEPLPAPHRGTAGPPADHEFAATLARAAGHFLVQPERGRATIIAGYHWFGDWGRDTMIALPGLCLDTGRNEAAQQILESYAQYVDDGMLPNRFPDAGQAPEYNTADASLWYFVATHRCLQAVPKSARGRAAGALWDTLVQIIERHLTGTRYGIGVDPADGLLRAGEPGTQLTWMDARVQGVPVTPRIGKPVEINALWHNALRTIGEIAAGRGDTAAQERYSALAARAAQSFAARFVRSDGRGLYDVIDVPGADGPDQSVRPNQVFAISLPYAPLDASGAAARSVIDTVEAELRTPRGLRSLAPSDPAYRGRYDGGPDQRDGAYHQGTAWPWLLGPYAEAHYRVRGDRQAAREILAPLRAEMAAYGVGSIAEVYDGDEPQRPNGCIAQAWSVAETLRVWNWLCAQPD